MSIRTARFPFRAGLVLTLALAAGACSAIRFGGAAEYDLDGSWGGSVSTGGERVPGTLTIEQADGDLAVSFVAPAYDLNAQGEGEVDDDGSFWIELSYDLQCPGNARLEGTASDDRRQLSGTLEATDCTGTVTGSFTFTRQDTSGAAAR